MSVVLINDSTLTDIADAIREQNGTQTTYLPSDMPDAIAAIEGGGGEIPDITVTSPDYAFTGAIVSTLWPNVKNHITVNLTDNLSNLFSRTQVQDFSNIVINITPGKAGTDTSPIYFQTQNLFNYAGQITNFPTINVIGSFDYVAFLSQNMFSQSGIKEIPEGWLESFGSSFWNAVHRNASSGYKLSLGSLFVGCKNLEKIHKRDLRLLYDNSSPFISNIITNSQQWQQCYCLQYIDGMPLQPVQFTSNIFGTTEPYFSSLKDYIFDTNNGTPYVREYANQTITVKPSQGVATSGVMWQHLRENHAAHQVTDAATYELYKNEDDWWTTLPEYSKYNHDSAVRTINSLPDTSAFLQTNGGTNTIKFEDATNKGSATDGGAIADLTAAEIAVATAKGWTVTLA